MSESSAITQAELAIVATFERERRRRLLATLLPFATLLTGLGGLGLTIVLKLATNTDYVLWLRDAVIIGIALLFGVGTWAMRRERLTQATIYMAAAATLGIFGNTALWVFTRGIDPYGLAQFTALGALILLAGLLGGAWSIVATTLFTNAFTVALLVTAHFVGDLARLSPHEYALVISVILVYQWIFGVIMIAIWLTYRQTLRAAGIAYERARRLDDLKDQFITHINHELRTPIMTMQGYVEYLRMGQALLSTDEQADALERASHTGHALNALLSGILDVRRIDHGDVLVPAPVNARAAVAAALLLVDPRDGAPSERDIQVTMPPGLTVWGDELHLQQVLTNLLGNALKYSPDHTPIAITGQVVTESIPLVRRWQRGASQERRLVEIAIRDYGLGVPPEQISLLFHRFARLPRDLASSTRGSGLGLYLCRIYVTAMGGTIHITSTGVRGEGTTVTLRLPLSPHRDDMLTQTAPRQKIAL